MRRMIDISTPYTTGIWSKQERAVTLNRLLEQGVYILTFVENGYCEQLVSILSVPENSESGDDVMYLDEAVSSLFYLQDAAKTCKWTITAPYITSNCERLELYSTDDLSPLVDIQNFTVYKII